MANKHAALPPNTRTKQDLLKAMKIDPDLHSYTAGRDDSLTAGGKENAVRPVTVRVFTQDIKEYTVTIVITINLSNGTAPWAISSGTRSYAGLHGKGSLTVDNFERNPYTFVMKGTVRH